MQQVDKISSAKIGQKITLSTNCSLIRQMKRDDLQKWGKALFPKIDKSDVEIQLGFGANKRKGNAKGLHETVKSVVSRGKLDLFRQFVGRLGSGRDC